MRRHREEVFSLQKEYSKILLYLTPQNILLLHREFLHHLVYTVFALHSKPCSGSTVDFLGSLQ